MDDYLKTVYNKFCNENENDNISKNDFKRILNILNISLELVNLDKNEYNYQELVDTIIEHYKLPNNAKVSKNKLKGKLKELPESTVNYILCDVKNNSISNNQLYKIKKF